MWDRRGPLMCGRASAAALHQTKLSLLQFACNYSVLRSLQVDLNLGSKKH